MKINDLLSLNFSKKITLKITFPYKFGKYEISRTETIVLHKNQTLGNGFRDFLLSNNIKMKAGYHFFLVKDEMNKTELSKEKKLSELNLEENDEIVISYEKLKNESYKRVNDDSNKQTTGRDLVTSRRNEDNNSPSIKIAPPKTYIKRFKIIISILIIFIILSIALTILLIPRNIPPKKFDKEEYIIDKKYPSNMLFRYSSNQENSFIIKGSNISKDNSTFEFSQIMDFIFIVRESHLENDEENLIEKEWYTGYIGFLNVTLKNSTHSMLNIYDQSLSEILKKNNLRRLENIDDVIDENKLCFAKIDFFKNGDIKKFYIPKEFSKINFKYIEETSKLIIPKISKNLYVTNINEKLNEIISNTTEENGDEINQTNYFNPYRILDYKNLTIKSKILKNTSKKRLLQNTNLFKNVNFNETSEDIYIENYLKAPSSKSINFDLREASKLNESSNSSNLTEFSIKNIECDEARMEGGMTNTTTFSIINEDGILESIVEKSISLMNMNNKEVNKNEEDEEEDEDEDLQILYSEVYNEKNELTLDDIKNETNVNNNFSFGIDNLTTLSSNIINCTDNFTNEKINQKIYKYFDSFDYIEYNKSEEEKEFSRILEENNLQNKYNRKLDEDNSYYGVKNFIYVKQLYKYNLIGLKMESQIFVENNPSTGKSNSYQVIIFGNKNTKI